MRKLINRRNISLALACFWLGLNAYAAPQTEKTPPKATPDKTDSKANATSGIVKLDKPEKTEKKKATKKTVAKKKEVFGPFVPPPPPHIPTFTSVGQMGTIDFDLSGISLMSESDLKVRLASCDLRLKNAQNKLKDQSALVDESKKRAQSFVELFQQGIVSKKELESSSKDAEQAVADLEELKGKCKDLELSMNAIKDRLSVLQKRKSYSTKLIGSSESRKQNKSKSLKPSKRKSESRSSLEEKASDKNKK